MAIHIAYFGNKCLRQRAKEIENPKDPAYQPLIDAMIKLGDETDGIGLAGPQVDKMIRLFFIRPYHYTVTRNGAVVEEGEGVRPQMEITAEDKVDYTLLDPLVFMNPVLSDPSEMQSIESEGCLSLPGLRGDVMRPDEVTVTAYDRDGNEFTRRFHGYTARQIMHENDHLNGVLFIDRMDPKERKAIARDLAALKKKYR